jgi:hypothetical protein
MQCAPNHDHVRVYIGVSIETLGCTYHYILLFRVSRSWNYFDFYNVSPVLSCLFPGWCFIFVLEELLALFSFIIMRLHVVEWSMFQFKFNSTMKLVMKVILTTRHAH